MKSKKLDRKKTRARHVIEASAFIPLLSAHVASGASAATANDQQAGLLEEVTVSAERLFLSVDTSGATNLPVPIESVPQSISLVSADFIKAADLKTLAQIAEYVPGAIQGGSQLGYGTRAKLRGFTMGVTVDGLNFTGSGFEADYAVYERIEFVKGPSSVVYGVSSPGGVVNFITKSAPSELKGYASASYGSWNRKRLEVQGGGPAVSSGKLKVLGLASYESGDSYIHSIDHEKKTAYVALDGELSDAGSFYLHLGHERTNNVAFDGVPALPDGSPAPVSRSFFVGDPRNRIDTSVYFGTAGLKFSPSDKLDLSVRTLYQTNQGDAVTPYGLMLNDPSLLALGLPPGTFVGAIEGPNETRNHRYGVGASAVYHLDALEDSFISIAALYQQEVSRGTYRAAYFGTPGSPYNTIANIFDGERAITEAFRSSSRADVVNEFNSRSDSLIFSAQSILKPVSKLSVLLGASTTKPETRILSTNTVYDFESQVSYRAGLVYEVLPGTNVYASFSQSFEPQRRRTVSGAILDPLQGEQYEIGIKRHAGRLLLTAAAFQISQKNAGQFVANIDGQDRYRPLGKVEHEGVEIQALGRLLPNLELTAGYAYLDAKVARDSIAANVGKTRPFLPKHTASLFATYSFSGAALEGLSLGGGGRFVGSEKTSFGATRELSSYALVDLMAAYTMDKWTVQLNARNILDKHYYTSNWDTLTFGLLAGEPANYTLSLHRSF